MDIKFIRMPGVVFDVEQFSHASVYKIDDLQGVVVIYLGVNQRQQEVFKGTMDECEDYLEKIHKELSGWTCQK